MMKKDRFEEEKVRNFYYLLAYAFDDDRIKFYDNEEFGLEKMNDIYDLFSIVLFIRLKEVMQEGMYCEYINYHEDLPYIKGRIDLLNTYRTNLLKTKNRIICDFEDYSENNFINQIIKTTLRALLNYDIIEENKIRLRKIYQLFENVDYIKDKNQIAWENLRFNRLNQKYEVIIKICKYILNNLIHNKDNQEEVFSKVDDNQEYHRLFEKFIRNYLRRYFSTYREHPVDDILEIKSEKIGWDVDKESRYIPKMHTDITISNLTKSENVKIIDAKFYSNIFSEKGFNGFDKKNINIGNLYQLFSYIMNKRWKLERKNIIPNVSGMLIYASVGSELEDLDVDFSIHGSRFDIEIIDFTQKFGDPEIAKIGDKTISGQMKKLAEKIYNNIK